MATGSSMPRATRRPREFAQETCWYQSQECPFVPQEDVAPLCRGPCSAAASPTVPVQLLRAGKMHHLTLPLKTEEPTEGYYRRQRVMLPAPWLGIDNYISRHLGTPPPAIPAAVPVMAYECGGPMIGLDGKGLGWVYARAASTFALVVPGGSQVVERLKDLKQGRQLGGPTPTEACHGPQIPCAASLPNATLEEVMHKAQRANGPLP